MIKRPVTHALSIVAGCLHLKWYKLWIYWYRKKQIFEN